MLTLYLYGSYQEDIDIKVARTIAIELGWQLLDGPAPSPAPPDSAELRLYGDIGGCVRAVWGFDFTWRGESTSLSGYWGYFLPNLVAALKRPLPRQPRHTPITDEKLALAFGTITKGGFIRRADIQAIGKGMSPRRLKESSARISTGVSTPLEDCCARNALIDARSTGDLQT